MSSIGERFSVAGAQTTGRSHLALGRNCQDAWSVFTADGFIVAAVADGCSGGGACEVGAHIGVRWMVAQLAEALAAGASPSAELLEQTLDELSHELVFLSQRLCKPDEGLYGPVGDFFLFTLIAAIITPEQTHVLLVGDGICAINGEVTFIRTTDGKSAPYPVYEAIAELDPESVDVRAPTKRSIPTAELRSLFLATDGLAGVIEADGGGPSPLLSWLDSDKALRDNPALLQHRLEVLAAQEPGLLDDATMLRIELRKERSG